MEIDDWRQMLYRLDHLIDPDPQIRKRILWEISKCARSSESQSTNPEAPENSARKLERSKQLTLL